MAVEFNYTDAQYVSWGNINNGLTSKTFLAWIKATSFTAGTFHGISGRRSTTDPGFSIGVDPATAYLWYHDSFSGGPGNWRTSTAITTGVFHLVGYTHDGTTAAPVAYHDGASVAVTTVATPSGSLNSDAAKPLVIGNYAEAADGTQSINGSIYAVLIYNRILTAAEILQIYTSKLAIDNPRGLVFAPALWQAAGNPGEGGTMAAGNTVPDHISGALGVPAGSPVFKSDTVLTIEGVA